MEISEQESREILSAHKIDVSLGDPRTVQEIATQFMFTGSVALEKFVDNTEEIRSHLWQQT